MMKKDSYDFLTGVYNRKGLHEKYEEMAASAACHLMFLDLDNFKFINDVYGHEAGDELLKDTAKMLQDCVGKAYVVRLGGDEFVLLFEGEKSTEELTEIAERILQAVRRRKRQFFSFVSFSIGILWNASPTQPLQEQLEKCDAAMYEAKQGGKDCYIFFNDIEEKYRKQNEIQILAQKALEEEKFEIRYQSVLNMQSSRLVQSNVCVSWKKDEDSVWYSRDFRPVFEKTGFIKKLDIYLFEKLCRDIYYFHEAGIKNRVYSILMSHLLLLDENLGNRLSDIMEQYGVKPEEIELNLKEAVFGGRNKERLFAVMDALRMQGYQFAVYRFGEDFSSFRYLRRLPISSIKMDEEYLKDNIQNSRGRQILKTLIRLAKDLKLLIVAQGVENQDETVFLSGCGCDAACGDFYGEPVGREIYLQIIQNQKMDVERCISFAFQGNLISSDHSCEGVMLGKGIHFTEGISDSWGGISFPGGEAAENVVQFSGSLFAVNSYTLSFWIKPEEVTEWASAIYMRYLEGFASYVPNLGRGQSVFRVSEDNDVNGWHDTFCRSLALHKWCFIVITYDSYSGSVRYYINGRKAGYRIDVPIMISCRQVLLGGDPFQKTFVGSVSALMLFETVKTDEEVAALYNSFFEDPGFRGEKEEFWMEAN